MNIHLDTGEHMRLGYNQPLYLLSLDYRYSYGTATLQLNAPLTAGQGDAVASGKDVIYDGLRQALGHAVPVASGGVVANEDSDAGILRDASTNGYVTVLSTERSGSAEFEFAYGAEFASHIAAFRPTFAKARVRYNPEGDAAVNRWQTARLQQLSDHCRAVGQRFMCELRVPPTAAQRKRADALGTTYDLLMRPALVLQAIRSLQDAGVEPDVWTVEGFDRRQDCEHVVATARRGGRSEVGCLVLGQNAGRERVLRWLENAASVPGFIGFAVGRTAFRNAVTAYAAKQVTRQEAAWLVARRYREWTAIFERGSRSHVDAA
jgi:myo-inositol catabolism protein IolC